MNKVFLIGREPLELEGELISFSEATQEQKDTCDRVIYGKNWKQKRYIPIEELKSMEKDFDKGAFGMIKEAIGFAFKNAKRRKK